jgi:RNA polymerase sigma-70 factor (ECF subfamily)
MEQRGPRPVARLDADMARLADGERAAFAPVFSVLWPLITTFTRRALGDGPDADDAAQEALEKVFTRANDYDASRPALTWALAIAGFEVRTVRKRRMRSRIADGADVDALHGAVPAADELLERAELAAGLNESLAALPEADRAAVEDAFFAELDGPRSASARKRKERALTRLRALFSGRRRDA